MKGLSGRTAVTIPKRVAVTEVSHWHSVNDASYLRILRDLECDIVGVSDRSAQIAEHRAQRFGGAPFTDYRQMIEATKPEFVVALGRHCDMPEIFRFLVGAGVPFVMEKPWGTDAETVAELARLAAAKGAWVGVPFMSRYSFWAATVKRMIEAGEFGKISHIFFRGIRPTMRRYVEWLGQLPGRLVFVAYPAGFDFLFVYWYLIKFVGRSPFSHSALDIKTFAMARLGCGYREAVKRNMPKEWFDDLPHTHVALDDAMGQGALFCNMLASRSSRRL